MKKNESFEELECWKAATVTRRNVKEIIAGFPLRERNSLADHMKRTARSVTRNIARGFGRPGYNNKMKSFGLARASLCELIDQYITARDEQYISIKEYETGREQIDITWKLLKDYMKYLGEQKKTKKTRSCVPVHLPLTVFQ